MGKVRCRAMIVAGILLACCACASALDPSLDVSQYAHTSWKMRDGFTKGAIWPIAQTPDGYLWLGTMFGLLRFDGVRAVPWHPPGGQQLPSDWTYSLLVARDRTLWIGTRKGLASWKDGRLTQYPELAGDSVFSLVEDHEGTVWTVAAVFATSPAKSRLCAIQSSRIECYGENEPFHKGLEWVYEDSRGNLWAGGHDGVWRWKPGPPQHYDVFNAPNGVSVAVEGDNGALVLAQHEGLAQLVNGKPEKYTLPGIDFQFTPQRLFRSSDGSLWIGTADRGLIHVHQGRADWFAQTDGLSGNDVMNIFEDREGNVWVSTANGLDRFREYAVPTVSSRQGVDGITWSVLAARDESVWLGSPVGVTRLKDGQVTIYSWPHPEERASAELIPGPAKNGARIVSTSGLPDRVQSLFEDDAGTIWATTSKGVVRWDGSRFVPLNGVPGGEVYSIAEDLARNVWMSSRDNGLFRVPRNGQIEQIPWSRLGHADYALAMAADPVKGGMWFGFPRGGIAYFNDGLIRASYTSSDGLGKGLVKELRFGTRGALWVATEGGLSRFRDGHITTLTSRNGLPCDTVHWSVEDNVHSVWLYMPCGLVRIARSELDAWVSDPKHTVQTTLYDISDGVSLFPAVGGWGPRVSKSPNGKIWFPGPDGASFIDPQHLPFNKLPPPVHIEQITAD
ncbi:MAG: hypothetical protein JOY95_04405, partial [Silvibacterium sp.]|nr:hypothetical protein [Silvibacterium sp.]